MMYWLVSMASLIAVVLNIKRSVLSFWIWSGTNAVWTYADLTHGLLPQAALQGVYFVLSIYGIWNWTARKKGPSHGSDNGIAQARAEPE